MKFSNAKAELVNWTLLKISWTDNFEVKSEFTFFVDYTTKNEYFTVPTWFITNFWSIPHFIQWILDLDRTEDISYIFHDYLYSKKARIYIKDLKKMSSLSKWILYWEFITLWYKNSHSCQPTRSLCDRLLCIGLEVEWMPLSKRLYIRTGLFFFWASHYRT